MAITSLKKVSTSKRRHVDVATDVNCQYPLTINSGRLDAVLFTGIQYSNLTRPIEIWKLEN